MSGAAVVPQAPAVARRGRSNLRTIFPIAVPAAVITLIVLAALLAPLITPYDPDATDLSGSLAGISGEHPLGQDALGRDVLSRLLYGARVSLAGPAIVVLVSTLVGVPLGLLAGYRGGVVDAVLSRTWDVVFAFPSLLLAIVVVATFGANFLVATLAISVIFTPIMARVVRGVVIGERRRTYVDAYRVLGFRHAGIAVRHVLPNVLPTVVAQATVHFGYALLDLAGLAFLGLGVQPPTPEWGSMLAQGRENLRTSPVEVIAAGLAIAITIIAFNLLGDALMERARRRTR